MFCLCQLNTLRVSLSKIKSHPVRRFYGLVYKVLFTFGTINNGTIIEYICATLPINLSYKVLFIYFFISSPLAAEPSQQLLFPGPHQWWVFNIYRVRGNFAQLGFSSVCKKARLHNIWFWKISSLNPQTLQSTEIIKISLYYNIPLRDVLSEWRRAPPIDPHLDPVITFYPKRAEGGENGPVTRHDQTAPPAAHRAVTPWNQWHQQGCQTDKMIHNPSKVKTSTNKSLQWPF